MNGGEIGAHLGLRRYNKEVIIVFNGEMQNLEYRVEKLDNHDNGASASDFVYSGCRFFRNMRTPWIW